MEAIRDMAPAAEASETVVCRPAGGMVALCWTAFVLEALLMLLIFSNVFLSSGLVWSMDLVMLLIGNICFMTWSILGMLYLRRAYVIANAKGLRWRQIGRWQEIAWQDVTAFYGYRQSGSGSSSKAKLSVKIINSTGSPVLDLSPEEWSSPAQLLKSIKQNAREAAGPGLSGPWVKKNPILPFSCRYDTTINRNILGWMEKVHKYGLLAVAVYFALQWFTTQTLPGWEWLLTPTGLFVLVKQALPLVLRPMYRATQPRLGDKVIADQEGLRFVTTQIDTTVRWADITDFYRVGIRYVIVTATGKFDFLDTLTDAERLRAVVPLLAVNAGKTGWRQTGGRYGARS